jgi:DNA-binding winged helix-turn-helix (wHTH) protein/TolB-like protein
MPAVEVGLQAILLATSMTPSPETLRFGDFELDPAEFALRRRGRRVRIERRPMDLLLLLVEHRGRLVTRDQIVERVWGNDVFVDVETGINTLVWKLRTALRDASDTPAFIETVSGRGYRFIARVETVAGQQIPEPPVEQPPPAPTAVPVEPEAAAIGRSASQVPVHRLRSTLLVSLGLVASVALLVSLVWPRSGRGDEPGRLSLAVLPFETLGLPADRQHLAGGLTDEISAWLAQVDPDRLTVRGRTMAYRGTTKSAAEIGRELSVDYLVEGSIASEGSQLRVTVRLIRTRDEEHVWSLPYERRPDSVLGLQEELGATIAQQVRLHLSPDRARGLERRQTRNAAAYDEYLRARYAETRRTPEAAQNAERHYKRAIALDPDYALAWSGLAMT